MKTLLIRAEDKNLWEKRCPIVPNDLKNLIENNSIKAYVQSSKKRFLEDKIFKNAGAEISQSMEEGQVIVGVKEIPVEKILDDKVYMFFSHTIKGQAENMPILHKIMSGGSTLIDYEKIADEQGRRKVYFGPYAGDAGAIDILWLMGEYWKRQGLKTPFISCKQALQYDSVSDARQHIKKIGDRIKQEGLPDKLCPLVIGVMGYGNVSKGAQHIFNALPIEEIAPEDLPDLVSSGSASINKVYLTVFREEHLVKRKDDRKFDLNDYFQNPVKYKAIFEKYLPYISILVNATYWDAHYPRFVTWENLAKLYSSDRTPKLQAIADITCDVSGSIECNIKTTDSGAPAYTVYPVDKKSRDGVHGDGIVILAIDNLPAELPQDASVFFSEQLSKYIPGILKADFKKNLEESGLPQDIKRAVIVYNGKLTPAFEYIKEYL